MILPSFWIMFFKGINTVFILAPSIIAAVLKSKRSGDPLKLSSPSR